MGISFRKLRADEIECRVGQKTKDGNKYSVLLFKTARTDMSLLDETVGTDNWQSEHYEVKGKDFCRIGIRIERNNGSEWVWKSDCGSESNVEAEKGESSDSFKRAGFQWGIGRELYSAPQIWLDSSISPYTVEVKEIAYDQNDKICRLVLVSKGKEVFRLGDAPKAEPQGVDHDTLERIREIVAKLEFEGKNLDDILKFYGVKTIAEIPLEKWEKMLAKVRGV